MKKIQSIVIFSFLFFLPLQAVDVESLPPNLENSHVTSPFYLPKINSPKNESPKEFYVLTIPKAGTFLLSKMLNMLTKKNGVSVWSVFPKEIIWKFAKNEEPSSLISNEEMEKSFQARLKYNQFHFAHFNFAENFQNYSLSHPEYAKIILIRDLRDVCVSAVYFLSERIEKAINSSSMDDKLMFIIQQGDLLFPHASFWKIKKLAQIAAKWINDPSVIVCRFEDLVGEKGGGSLKAQQKQIVMIANSLNIPLSSKNLDKITSQLFGVKKGPDIGGGGTYREGKIGSWQTHFKEEHKVAFNRILGPVQQELGYPLF